jgi:DNA-binding NarL/FixJ family response regulator
MAARILIADDSPLVQTSLTQLLESYCDNWKVCGLAATGRQAVEKAVESQPDLIILDLKMPLMDGLTASVIIGHYLPKVPILMYTVHKSLDLDATARKAGVARVISKAEPEELLKAAEELLGGQRITVSGASI